MNALMISKALVVGAYHGKLRELARLGVTLSLVVPSDWHGVAPECTQASEYEIVQLKCIFSGRNHFHFYPALGRMFRGRHWDIVHVDEEPFSLVTFQAMRLCAARDNRALFFTWQNLFKKYPLPFQMIERHNFDVAQAAVAGSAEAEQILRRRGFAKPISVIPQFGVDPHLFRKRDAGRLREKLFLQSAFVIGYIGRVVEEKGLGDLLDALALLSEDCVLVVVGSGPHQVALKRRSEEMGMKTRLRWVSAIESTGVPEYLNAFDVLVLPSRTRRNWKEQFGRVLVEAMACEVPVIGSSSGEIPRVIADAGLVFPEGNAPELAQCVRRLGDSGLRALYGKKGRARVLAYFTHEQIARQTVRVYRSVLSGETCV